MAILVAILLSIVTFRGHLTQSLPYNGGAVENPNSLCQGLQPDPNFSDEWQKDTEPNGGYYLSLSSLTFYKHYALILGSDPNPYNSTFNMCLRGMFDYVDETGEAWTKYGYNAQGHKVRSYARIFCVGFSCTFTPLSPVRGGKAETIKAYVGFHSDKKKYMILNFCYSNFEVGWGVLGASPALSERTRSEVVTWVKANMKHLSDDQVVSPYDHELCSLCTPAV